MLLNPWKECRRLRQLVWSHVADAQYLGHELRRAHRALEAIKDCPDIDEAKVMARMALRGDWRGE